MRFLRRMRKGLSEPPMSEAVARAITLDRRTEVREAAHTAAAAEVARKIIPIINHRLEKLREGEESARPTSRWFRCPSGYKSEVKITHLFGMVTVSASDSFMFLPLELEAEYEPKGYKVEVRRGKDEYDRFYAVDIIPVLSD